MKSLVSTCIRCVVIKSFIVSTECAEVIEFIDTDGTAHNNKTGECGRIRNFTPLPLLGSITNNIHKHHSLQKTTNTFSFISNSSFLFIKPLNSSRADINQSIILCHTKSGEKNRPSIEPSYTEHIES